MSTTSAASAPAPQVPPAPPAPRPAWRRNAQIGVGLAISLLCLWLAFRGLELGEVWRALAEARYWLLLPALALYFGGVWVRAVRWGYLLRPVTPRSPGPRRAHPQRPAVPHRGHRLHGQRRPAGPAGGGGALLRPAPPGGGARCPPALGTVLLERVMDGIMMLAFMAVALPLLPFSRRPLPADGRGGAGLRGRGRRAAPAGRPAAPGHQGGRGHHALPPRGARGSACGASPSPSSAGWPRSAAGRGPPCASSPSPAPPGSSRRGCTSS